MVKVLIENGADVNAQMADGKTALMFAAMFDKVEIIDILLENGADAFLQTSDGLIALTLAQAMGADAARAKLEKLSENRALN
jgi:ankyrin repeat protein